MPIKPGRMALAHPSTHPSTHPAHPSTQAARLMHTRQALHALVDGVARCRLASRRLQSRSVPKACVTERSISVQESPWLSARYRRCGSSASSATCTGPTRQPLLRKRCPRRQAPKWRRPSSRVSWPVSQRRAVTLGRTAAWLRSAGTPMMPAAAQEQMLTMCPRQLQCRGLLHRPDLNPRGPEAASQASPLRKETQSTRRSSGHLPAATQQQKQTHHSRRDRMMTPWQLPGRIVVVTPLMRRMLPPHR